MTFVLLYQTGKYQEEQILETFLEPLAKKTYSSSKNLLIRHYMSGVEALEVHGDMKQSKILAFAKEKKIGLEMLCKDAYFIQTLKQLPALKKTAGRTQMKKATTTPLIFHIILP